MYCIFTAIDWIGTSVLIDRFLQFLYAKPSVRELTPISCEIKVKKM